MTLPHTLYEVVDGRTLYAGRTVAQWLPDVIQRIVDRFSPLKIVLFGSLATGTDTGESDIDLLIVLRKLNGRHHDVAVSILRELRDIPVPIDLLVTDEEEIQRRGDLPGILRVALREGSVVYG
jgi:predicted nucleotidyltransferase